MPEETQAREEWSATVHSLLVRELRRAVALGVLTAAEANQLAARFLILLDQALDLTTPPLQATAGPNSLVTG